MLVLTGWSTRVFAYCGGTLVKAAFPSKLSFTWLR